MSLRHLILFAPLLVVLVGGLLVSFGPHAATAEEAAAEQPERLLRHVVLFKFKETSSEADVQKVVDAFRALPSKIDAIHDFEYGTDNSPEGLSDGFTHCFLVTFKSEEDRAAYLPHPEHEAFVAVLRPHLDRVLVVDYWAGT